VIHMALNPVPEVSNGFFLMVCEVELSYVVEVMIYELAHSSLG